MVKLTPEEIAALREVIASQEREQEPQKTGVEKMLDHFREGHTPEEIEYVYNFVLKAFAKMITGTKPHHHIAFGSVVSTPNTRKKGMVGSSTPDGGSEHFGNFVTNISLYYIDVILANKDKTVEETVWAMIEDSESGGGKHPEFRFITNGDKLELWTHEFK